MGISATPIIIEVAVPIKALAAPEIGSVGPSSGRYSRGRYLLTLADSPMHTQDYVQLHIGEVHFALLC
jgi:hypothetical protein